MNIKSIVPRLIAVILVVSFAYPDPVTAIMCFSPRIVTAVITGKASSLNEYRHVHRVWIWIGLGLHSSLEIIKRYQFPPRLTIVCLVTIDDIIKCVISNQIRAIIFDCVSVCLALHWSESPVGSSTVAPSTCCQIMISSIIGNISVKFVSSIISLQLKIQAESCLKVSVSTPFLIRVSIVDELVGSHIIEKESSFCGFITRPWQWISSIPP